MLIRLILCKCGILKLDSGGVDMAKKFIDLDANLEVKNDKQENLAVDKNGMISAPSSFESLDESDLLIVPKEKVETL